MKLATLKDASRDGKLVIVSRDLSKAVFASNIAETLQKALENWDEVEPLLSEIYDKLNANTLENSFAFEPKKTTAPLPRAFQWCDGSAFLNHGNLMQQAFNLPPIPDVETIPLMYQGGSDDFLGATDDVPMLDESHGIDFEGEFGVITDDVSMNCSAEKALSHIKLLVQINDWSLRKFAPREMQTGFGFFQAKPSTSFASVAVTPDELDENWKNGRVNLPLNVKRNGEWFGNPNGDEMNFSFSQLISHASATRRLRAGTIIGSGTVSNISRATGSACISERRVIEIIDEGVAKTEFLRFGETVSMEVFDPNGQSIFGKIEQKVIKEDSETRRK